MNTFTYALIIALIAGFLLQWRLSVRHIRHITAHRDAVPDNFADKIPLAAHRKAADYTCAKTRLRLVELVVSSLILLLLTLGGGLDWIDAVVRAYPLSAPHRRTAPASTQATSAAMTTGLRCRVDTPRAARPRRI